MQKYNFSYDQENDDLFLYNPNSKSKGSIELGDLIFDFNSKKEFVGIQIMNASKLLKNLIDEKTISIKSILSELKDCRIQVKQESNILILKMYLISKSTEIVPILTVPQIRESSPALAYA
ncbi:DUF2283 domain-containing protein [Candidatus Woesearchaeota archaeon]|nr:DUF2283 domain-containing protein [Candidatus Woesearchaeota archaeon]